jgi:nucleoside-diphosphate-sugar epimerase
VTLAERAFWDHFRPPRGYDAVALASGAALGPGLVGDLERWMRPCPAELETGYGHAVDVRDLAACVVRALAIDEAGGERVVLSAGPVFGNDMAIVSEQ